jgi:RNA polymerase sigma-70 factor, ECF subfamily
MHARAPSLVARVIPFPEAATNELDDAAIVALMRAGDPRAPRLVWHRLSPMVGGMMRRALGPEHDIEDLTQEVFLTLFGRIGTLREPQALRAFVISIASHAIRAAIRRKVARRWLHFGTLPVTPAREVDLDSREALVRLYRILDRLGSNDRTVFVLRFFEGLEVAEVAQAMGVSHATTKRRIAHAWARVVTHAQRDDALVAYLTTYEPAGAS